MLATAILTLAAALRAQSPTEPAGQGAGSYFFAYRAPRHIKYSKPEVFHEVADGLLDFLKSKQVLLVSDPERGNIQTSEQFSVGSLLNLARQAGASHLICLTVDRPLTAWVKITLQCYDLTGKLLWDEKASEGGGLSGKGGVRSALEKIEKAITARLGQPGLPLVQARVTPAPDKPAAEPKANPDEKL
jgi:hypothetical protein